MFVAQSSQQAVLHPRAFLILVVVLETGLYGTACWGGSHVLLTSVSMRLTQNKSIALLKTIQCSTRLCGYRHKLSTNSKPCRVLQSSCLAHTCVNSVAAPVSLPLPCVAQPVYVVPSHLTSFGPKPRLQHEQVGHTGQPHSL